MTTLFKNIISGKEECYKVAEDNLHIAFLEKRPVKKGHIIVFPKKETDFLYDMDDESLCKLNLFAKKVSHALRKVVACKKIGIAVIGLELPHVHIHLVPLNKVSELNFSSDRMNFTEAELSELALKIISMINL